MLKTRHLRAENRADIALAAEYLAQGKLVAFATETVYGLGANALDLEAVEKIFAAKKRPAWDPLIVHIASVDQLPAITVIPKALQTRIETLAEAFWPGPLTLLLPRSTSIPDAVTACRPLVGVRIPSHPFALAMLGMAGVPVAAPSANLFGHISPTTAAHVLADLDGRIDAVLDGGPTNIGVESTVLDPASTPMTIYRPGAVTAAQITAVTGVPAAYYVSAEAHGEDVSVLPKSLPSPGVGMRHYAPRARLVLSAPNQAALRAALQVVLREATGTVAVFVPQGWLVEKASARLQLLPWWDWDSDDDLAATLFAKLRAADRPGVTEIVCPLPEAGGLRDAIRDRLQKAARSC